MATRKPVSHFENLKYEHKEVLELGKFYYETIMKLAPMSFVFNGALLTALHYMAFSETNNALVTPFITHKYVFWGEIMLVGILGVIFNAGAACAYSSTMSVAGRLSQRFQALDQQLGLKISECNSELASNLGKRTHWLTLVFFLAWILVWFAIVLFAAFQMYR